MFLKLTAIDFKSEFALLLLLQIVVVDGKNDVTCFDDPPPSLQKASQSATPEGAGRVEATCHILPDLVQILTYQDKYQPAMTTTD